MVFYWGKQVQLMIIHWNWRVFDLFRQIRVDWAYEMNHPWNLSFCYSYSYPPVKHETSPMDCIRIKISIWLLKGKPKNSNDDRMFSTMFLLFFFDDFVSPFRRWKVWISPMICGELFRSHRAQRSQSGHGWILHTFWTYSRNHAFMPHESRNSFHFTDTGTSCFFFGF